MWKRLYLAQDIILSHLRVYCPIDTGALSASITSDNNTFVITIGDEDVQYAPFTNESWDNFDPPLKGHKNPNEGWIDRALQSALPVVDQMLSGAITEDEAQELVKANNEQYEKRLNAAAERFRKKARNIL